MNIERLRRQADQQEPQDDRCDLILIVSASVLALLVWRLFV